MLGQTVSTALLLVVVGPIALAIAHEKAVLKSPQSAVAVGGTLTLNGSDFEEGETYRLKLVGALNEYKLLQVKADMEGTFSIKVEIPRTVKSGEYKLTAIAPDGDAVARLDLTVLEASPANEAEMRHDLADEPEAGHGANSDQMARADDLPIQRSRSGAEWGVIGLVIGLAGGLGVSMIRRS